MSTNLPQPEGRLAELRSRLPGLMAREQDRIRRRLDGIRNTATAGKVVDAIAQDIEKAEQRLARRKADVPMPSYPEALPVSQRKDEILAAIRDHQVVIVAGETGS